MAEASSDRHGDDGEALFRYRRGRMLFVTAGALVFAGVGVVLLVGQPVEASQPIAARLIGAALAALFGAVALKGIGELRDQRPVVRIGPEGISDRRLGPATIPWAAIDGIDLHHVKRDAFIGLDVEQPERFLVEPGFIDRMFYRANARRGQSRINIALNPLDARADEFAAAIQRFSPPSPDDA
ncbi:STM3941 family protein [Oceanibacterium hippocampi]|uniref:PH domain-containing protein n=1 Tax=Oceanibacterium hippocampi TaxID=745714 RepID=A0A1Y5TVC4_9PROT|nr:STM3941 family protein [Oceanibacterium hippocampi]SLN73610.1 hypothetical protein OCH7691_03628 [Oceanibacterium hippocampi]